MFRIARDPLTDRLLATFERTGTLPPLTGGDHDDDPKDPPTDPKDPKDQKDPKDPKDPPTPPKDIPAEIQTYFNGVIADERRRAEERTETRLREEAERERQREESERETREAEERGEFETVKASLTERAEAAETERDEIKAEHDALGDYFAAQYTAALEELPEFVTAFKPADDAPFTEKVAWLTKAQEAARKAPKGGPGNPPNPTPRDRNDERDERFQKQRQQSRPRYRV